MRHFMRWWDTLDRPERIVAMSLAAGGTISIVNSITWAIAVCYMSRQKARANVELWRDRSGDDSVPQRSAHADRTRAVVS